MSTTNDIAVIEPEHWALRDIAQKINDTTQTAEGQARLAVQSAMAAGDLLTHAKSYVAHDQWNEWLLANCAVAPRTAQAYMQLFKKVPTLEDSKARRVADLPLRQAIKAIATVSEAPPSSRDSGIRTAARSDADKVIAVFQKSASGLRDSARRIGLVRELNAKQVAALRSKLLAALDALDTLQAASVSNEAKAVTV